MSLMQLLTVTRSFGAVKDEPSPYKMGQENLLPRFGKGHDGEAGEEARGIGEKAAEILQNSVLEQETPAAPVPPEQAPEAPAQNNLDLEQSINTAERVRGRVVRKVASPWMGWSLLGNLKRRSRSRRGPVQAELALDMVKPVRNDLKESDLELVACRQADKPTPSTRGRTDRSVTSSLSGVWGRVKTLVQIRAKQT